MSKSYMAPLALIAQDCYDSWTEIKGIMRRHKVQARRAERELSEISDLMDAWQCLAEC